MKRDDLIALLRKEVPENGEVYVVNANIHDDTMSINECEGKESGGFFQFTPRSGTYYLLKGNVGY